MPDCEGAGASGRQDLRADCSNCLGLCCVALTLTASADFAIDKPAGQACPNLDPDLRCVIHRHLRREGFPGCAVYDCFGAGQKISQFTFGGRDWRDDQQTAEQMFAAFPVMRQLHELLWYLTEALALPAAGPVTADLRAAAEKMQRLTAMAPDRLVVLEIATHRERVTALLRQASALARAGTGGTEHSSGDLTGADLIGAQLAGADLTGVCLRGARLLGADLTDADLTLADLTGADLRAATMSGANMSRTIFVTQSQLEAAVGDATTLLPAGRTRPAHWSSPRASRTRKGASRSAQR